MTELEFCVLAICVTVLVCVPIIFVLRNFFSVGYYRYLSIRNDLRYISARLDALLSNHRKH